MSLKPKVALSQDFLLQLAKLPVNVHSKVMKWAILFQTDPKSPSINYENINGARDSNLKSIRLDKDWRGIVFKPDTGDVYVLLYVDHHDDAYRWAENRKLTINPVTGAMQMVMFESVVQQVESPNESESLPAIRAEVSTPTTAEPVSPPLFGSWDDRELMSIGVPEEALASVRAITSEVQLDTMQTKLPLEAY